MQEAKIPFKKMVFVCTNQREGKTACGNRERGMDCGENLLQLLREELKKRGLKGKIRVAKSGCMDVCAAGPNIMVFDEAGQQTWYRGVKASDLPALCDIIFG